MPDTREPQSVIDAAEQAAASGDYSSAEQLLRVHSSSHVERVERVSSSGGGMLDPDTVASPRSSDAALRSAGGAVRAVD